MVPLSLTILATICNLTSPLIIQSIIKYNAMDTQNLEMVYILLGLFAVTRITNGIIVPVNDYLNLKMMLAMRLSLESAVFAKSLKVSLLS